MSEKKKRGPWCTNCNRPQRLCECSASIRVHGRTAEQGPFFYVRTAEEGDGKPGEDALMIFHPGRARGVLCIQMVRVDRYIVPRLQAYMDSWELLAQSGDLLSALRGFTMGAVETDDLAKLVESLGYERI